MSLREQAKAAKAKGNKNKKKNAEKKMKSHMVSPYDQLMIWEVTPESNKILTILQNGFSSISSLMEKRKQEERVKGSEYMSGMRVGINAVTRSLEKDELSLFIVSKKVNPSHIISHLPIMSHTKRVPMITLDATTDQLGELLGIKSAIAVGFVHNKQDNDNELVQNLLQYATVINVPWLKNNTNDNNILLPLAIETQTSSQKRMKLTSLSI